MNSWQQELRHFVAYHNSDEFGPYYSEASKRKIRKGEEHSFVTAKSFREETLKGQRLWAIEGAGSPRRYRLISSGLINRITKWKRPASYRKRGREYGLRIHFKVDATRDIVDLTDFSWFRRLRQQQQSFRNGFNRIADTKIIRALAEIARSDVRTGRKSAQKNNDVKGFPQRRSSSAASEILHDLIPENNWIKVLKIVAHSIEVADQATRDKWGVRINSRSVMLKVGFMEVLQLGRGWFHLLIDKKLVAAKLRSSRGIDFDDSEYLNAPGCGTCDMDIATLLRVYKTLLPAHESAIRVAARSRRHTSTAKDHSPGVIIFLSQELGLILPQPAYLVASSDDRSRLPEEIGVDEEFAEGAAIQVLVNRYERDPAARAKCLTHYGISCVVCGISMARRYGPAVDGLIHVHHLTPLASAGAEFSVDPIRDMRPVCPNCHAVIHSTRPPLTLEKVQKMISEV